MCSDFLDGSCHTYDCFTQGKATAFQEGEPLPNINVQSSMTRVAADDNYGGNAPNLQESSGADNDIVPCELCPGVIKPS